MYKNEDERGYHNEQLRGRQKLHYLPKKNMLPEKFSSIQRKNTSMGADEMLTTIFTFKVKFLQLQYHQMQP